MALSEIAFNDKISQTKVENLHDLNMKSPCQNGYNTLKSVSVIIPTLNEEQGIGLTIKEIIENIDAEIINIDANSTDKTSEIAASLGAKIIKQKENGKGAAIAQALNHLNQNTKYVVLIDGDYTYPATYIPQMIKILEKNTSVEMVTGKRFNNKGGLFSYFKKHAANPYTFGNLILAFTHRLLNGVSMEDPLTGLRVLRCDHIKNFRPKSKSFDIEAEINNYIRRRGGKIVEFPIKYRLRLGEKKLKMRHGLIIFLRIIFMAIENLLLRIKSLIEKIKIDDR
jgi:dolichol-phosphate mannosyltransferase